MMSAKDYLLHIVSFYGVSDESTSFYSEQQLRSRQDILHKSAKQNGGVDIAHAWNLTKLKTTSYYRQNEELLSRSRGCGFWAWKPFIILETMKKMKDGDFVFYCDIGRPSEVAEQDHGNQIHQPLAPLVEWAKNNEGMMPGVYLPHHGKSAIWIKSDCFKIMQCQDERYKKIPTIQAGYSMWQKTPKVMEFLEEWKELNLDSRLISDDPNELGEDNSPGFIRHCHDQATLTLLCAKTNTFALGDTKLQFWGFRNINFIIKKAAFEIRKKDSNLSFNSFNRDYDAIPTFLTNWIELLYCERRQEFLRMLVMGNDEWQVDMWTRYFPKAEVISEAKLNPLEKIALSPNPQKYVYDFIITNAMAESEYTVRNFVRIYEALNEGGAAFIGPLPEDANEVNSYARSIANNEVFYNNGDVNQLPEHSPKIHNSKNPIFLQSGLSRFIILYKPYRLIEG